MRLEILASVWKEDLGFLDTEMDDAIEAGDMTRYALLAGKTIAKLECLNDLREYQLENDTGLSHGLYN